MTLKTPVIARLMALSLAVTLLPAAGEFPVAAIAAGQLAALPDDEPATDTSIVMDEVTPNGFGAAVRPAQLATLVARTIDNQQAAYGDRECLARAVYFEARGEPLEGQLAVAQVILNRVASGRFADTVCGVISQRGQFSFDHARLPAQSRDWRTAQAIAAIAATASWDAMAPRATAFHATRINASWSTMHKVGTIGNHVFYR